MILVTTCDKAGEIKKRRMGNPFKGWAGPLDLGEDMSLAESGVGIY